MRNQTKVNQVFMPTFRMAIVFLVICTTLIETGYSQTQSIIDSLEQVIKNSSGIAKGEALAKLNEQIKYTQPKYSLEVCSELIEIGKQQGDDVLLLKGMSGKSFAYLYLYELDSSYQLSMEGRVLAERAGQPDQVQRFYELITHYHRYIGSMDSALYYSRKVVDLGANEFIPNFNLGGVLREMGNHVEALEYLNLAREIATESGNPTHIGAVYNVLSNLYRDVGDIDNAIKSGEKFLEIIRETGHTQGELSALIFLATTTDLPLEKQIDYIQQGLEASRKYNRPDYHFQFRLRLATTEIAAGNFQSALDTLMVLNQIESDAKKTALPSLLDNMALCYLNLGQLEKAETYAKEALEISNARDKFELSTSYRTLLEVYSKTGNYKAYHDLIHTYGMIRDSLERQNRLTQLAYTQAQMDDVEKQKEIALLNQDLLQERTRRNRMIYGSAIAAFLLLLIIYFRTREARLQRKTAEELSGVNRQLKELDEMKGRFFANVSHELRTPLSLIKGPVSRLLNQASIGKENTRLVEMISRNSNQLEKRINEILDLAKLDAAKLTLEEKDIEMVGFSRRLLAYFESMAQQSNITTEFVCVEAEVNALADMKKIEMILHNFMANAIKFTPAGGQVRLHFQQKDEDLEWIVEDTGRGIEADQLEKVFERFYQNPHNKTIEGGTGIGLALSRELAQVMHGRVWAESELGKGSRFFLRIPFQAGQTITGSDNGVETEKIREKAATPVLTRSANVLLVEDNPDLREYISSIIEKHQVRTAANGIRALEQLEKQVPDLIVSDIMMPEMDGFELVERLKSDERYAHIPVIMLTARAAHEDKMKALRIGVDDYLLKPFHEEELLTRIDNALARLENRNVEEEPDEAPIHHSQVWLGELEAIFREHMTDSHFTLDSAADKMHISKRQLQRRIKKFTGLTASDYVREIKLNQAREFLESGRYETVAEVSFAVGFEHTHYFSNLYLDRFGRKPVDYLH